MKYLHWYLLGFLVIATLGGCGSSNPIVATVGNEKITLQDFENDYAKNNGGWTSGVSSSLADRQHFLDLLVNFRLKVEAAKAQGLLNDSSVLSELNSYQLSVSRTYILEKELIVPHLKEMYDHKLEDLEVAHIFIRMPQNPKPADTVTAYEKAMKVISRIPKVPFDTLAKEYSDDKQTANNGGFIGWLAPGRIPGDMESAIYGLKAGQTSPVPFRSPYGYHIFKVVTREPAKGSLRIRHIMKRFNKEMSDTTAVRDTVWQLYREIKHGASFDSLARLYSDDIPTRERGGDLGFYSRENIRPNLAEVIFNLPVDSVSEPLYQPYGYHIFEVTDRKPVPSYSETEKDLRSLYQQMFYKQDYQKYIDHLRPLYPVVIDSPVVRELETSLDTTKSTGSAGWSDTLSPQMLAKTLLTCTGKPCTVKDFVDVVESNSGLKGTPLKKVNIPGLVDRVADEKILDADAATAVDRYPELKQLMDEYLDGILLYRIEQEEVWKKITTNDSLMRIFYDSTKSKYRWPERVNFAEVFVTSDSVKKEVQRKLDGGADFPSIAEEFTARPGYREKQGIWGLQPYDLNELAQKASKMPIDSVSGFFPYESGWSMIKVLGRDSSHVKTFEEAGPELASAYQEQASKIREQQWLESLRKKFGVTVNDALLSDAFKKKPSEQK